MKSKILMFALAALMITACGGKKKFKIAAADVPAAVTTAFQEKYPGAAVGEWEAEKNQQAPSRHHAACQPIGQGRLASRQDPPRHLA